MSTTRDPGDALRSLLAEAVTDGPATPDLLAGVRRRQRRRRVLIPAASLTAAAACGVATLAIVSVDGAPSAQAQVIAAVRRSSGQGFRVHIVAGRPAAAWDGAFDPSRQNGWLTGPGVRRVDVGGMSYEQYSGARASALPAGKRWVSVPRLTDAQWAAAPAAIEVLKRAPEDPQLALRQLRAATAVHESGSVAGPGWHGHRYTFSITGRSGANQANEKKSTMKAGATGTVSVDSHGLVRALEMTLTIGGSGKGADVAPSHSVMRFDDYGTRVNVGAPPAAEVVPAAELQPARK